LRESAGDLAVEVLSRFAPNLKAAILHRQVITPLDLEGTYGVTEGNPYHGELTLDQFFFMRPVAGWAQYRTPIAGLYLCGAGAHPGGGVTGAAGKNAARTVLEGRKNL
jgi:phytoene dehydrogenase-like protein